MEQEILSNGGQTANDAHVELPSGDAVRSDTLHTDKPNPQEETERVEGSSVSYTHAITSNIERKSTAASAIGLEAIPTENKTEIGANLDISPDELDGANELLSAGNDINNPEYIDDQDAEIANAFKQGNKSLIVFSN